MESDSDVSLSPVPAESKKEVDPRATLKPTSEQFTAQPCVSAINGTNTRIKASAESTGKPETRVCADVSQKDSNKPVQQQNEQKQINYMEPSNLDLSPHTAGVSPIPRAPNTCSNCATNPTFTHAFPSANG
ncbi:hypothetical protein FBUS_08354, partial [Fasciolopsis buskii]